VESMAAQSHDKDAGSWHVAALPEDEFLVAALRRGDETAFALLLDTYHASMVRLALFYVASDAVAEEVVQETWLAVIRGLERFEGRSSLKTWIFRILTNHAKERGQREGRSVVFSAVWNPDREPAEPAVAPERFRSAEPDHDHWVSFPRSWEDIPEQRFLAKETRVCIAQALALLPPSQRAVMTLHDIEGWAADDVCEVLGISTANQRVLLHRARSRVRGALERYFDQEAEVAR
jgi:RNA polymerase sigma-70 factor (ECF subfamily)